MTEEGAGEIFQTGRVDSEWVEVFHQFWKKFDGGELFVGRTIHPLLSLSCPRRPVRLVGSDKPQQG